MKILLFILLFFPAFLYAQEFEYRVTGEKKINDTHLFQTVVLTIFNNSKQPICLRLSTTFRERNVSRDTIILASMKNDTSCQYFKIWNSEENNKIGYNDFQTFPLVLNSKASFIATIGILLNLHCKNVWMEYRYLSQSDIGRSNFSKLNNAGRNWDVPLRPKFHSVRIPISYYVAK